MLMNQWNYAQSVPHKLYVACSGGVDSVAAAHILSEWRDITLVHYHHNDHAGDLEQEVVAKLAGQLGVPAIFQKNTNDPAARNREAQWRAARYEWFHSLGAPVCVAHTLDDAVEWYLITCLRGEGHFMEYSNRNVIRPFLLTDKGRLVKYAEERSLTWWEDPGNHDPEFSLRSRVRQVMWPAVVHCEPGFKNMIKRRLVEKLQKQLTTTDK